MPVFKGMDIISELLVLNENISEQQYGFQQFNQGMQESIKTHEHLALLGVTCTLIIIDW